MSRDSCLEEKLIRVTDTARQVRGGALFKQFSLVGIGDGPRVHDLDWANIRKCTRTRHRTLTPKWTALIGVEYDQDFASGNRIIYRADYSYRDEMFGQSINNRIESRELVNFVVSYEHGDGD